MAVKSAYEDLRHRTLGGMEGIWAKLAYIAERRSSNGHYRHWGFERTHGTESAQDAFARVHQSLVETVLQTRLRSLKEDLAQASSVAGTNPVSYVAKLTADVDRLLPSNCSKMTESHLISILNTLAILENRSLPDSRFSLRRLRLAR